MSTSPESLTLALAHIEELFQAPVADPFSVYEVEILGQSGMEWLRKRYTRRLLPRHMPQHLLIRLPDGSPAQNSTADLGLAAGHKLDLLSETRTAILRYCAARIEANRDARRLARMRARQELLIAAAVTVFALAMLGWYAISAPSGSWSYLLAIATLFAVYAAALAIWDALESWFFDWMPYTVDNRAYRWISNLQVQIVSYHNQGTATPE